MIVEIQSSEIHGHGVFAMAQIEKDQWQHIYGHTVGTWNQYCFEGDPYFQPHAPWCYLNHSETPNCEIYDEDGNLYIIALYDIAVGEELTFDYANGDYHDTSETISYF